MSDSFEAPWTVVCSPGSSGNSSQVSQARILERVAISFSRGSSQPRDGTWVSCIGRWILYHWATLEARPVLYAYRAKSLQSCPTHSCDPIDCSPPDSSVHGISQARIWEWVAISSSRGIFPPRGQATCKSKRPTDYFCAVQGLKWLHPTSPHFHPRKETEEASE